MRAAFDVTPAKTGTAGVARYVVDLSLALDRLDGVDIVRVSASSSSGGRLRRGAASLSRRAFYSFGMAREVRRKDAQLVHIPSPDFPRRLRVPMVLTVHDMLPWRYPEYLGRKEAHRAKALLGRAARRASRIIVGSEYTRDEVSTLLEVDPARVRVTPWGLDLRFAPVESTAMWLARRFGIPGRYVLCTGTREPQKNLVTLISAFEGFQLDNPEYTLVVVGERPDRGSPIEAAMNGSTARIVRAGFVTDEELVRLYGSAACFAFPSLYEGFGFPPIEAMACGAPVVCSDRASLPEIVGGAAVLVDPTGADLIAEGLQSVLDSPQRASEYRDRGLRHARRYTWSRCAEATAQIYREALEEPVAA